MRHARIRARIQFWLVPLLLGCLGVVGPETRATPQEKGDVRGNAFAFLDGVLKRYATAKTYHIELISETQINGDLRKSWEKRSLTAAMLPDKRYRFEGYSGTGGAVQVSDGVFEWFYLPQIQQYTKEPAPPSVPGPVPKIPIAGLGSIREAQRILGRFSNARSLIRSASYLADDKIDVDGKSVLCTVIQAQGLLPRIAGVEARLGETYTFWIDKQKGLIWKETAREKGPIFPDTPHTYYTLDTTTLFKVSDPDAQSAPDELFFFKPTAEVELVKEFAVPRDRMVREIEGRPVPVVNLLAKDSKMVSLETYRGKPLLIDFWATWCAPCVESIPAMEKLYSQTASKGLVLVSIDDDEDAQTATEFLAKRKEPWMNFHLTDAIADAFPAHGIPYFVLVDASGKVVYSNIGLDEVGLRAAVAKLGPEFAGVSKNPEPPVDHP
jgi:thiol-disulfide isomerase/thioredoxin